MRRASEWKSNIAVPSADAYGGPAWRPLVVRLSGPDSHVGQYRAGRLHPESLESIVLP